MTFDFHPEAEAEFIEAIAFYEKAEPSLGEEFALEVRATVRNILSYPRAWPTLDRDMRRCLVNRLPYGIPYSIEPERIYVPAVMHLHRRPRLRKSAEDSEETGRAGVQRFRIRAPQEVSRARVERARPLPSLVGAGEPWS